MSCMTDMERLDRMYGKQDTLSIRIRLHDRYGVNPYGWRRWVFDQYDFPPNARVLELGCGTGVVWQENRARLSQDARVTLSDFSPLMVDKARVLLGDLPGFEFEVVDIQAIPMPDACLDAVIANHMLYHVPNLNKGLSEVARVLKRGGRFYATTTGVDTMRELAEIYRKMEGQGTFSFPDKISFTMESGRSLLEAYFERVTWRAHEDALAVTDLEDLMAYILSYNEVPEAARERLYDLLRAGVSPDGAFHIQKVQGMFVCEKACGA